MAGEGPKVVAAGWHDVYLRWDISTPEAVVGRLEELPGQGTLKQPGKKLFAERYRASRECYYRVDSSVMIAAQ